MVHSVHDSCSQWTSLKQYHDTPNTVQSFYMYHTRDIMLRNKWKSWKWIFLGASTATVFLVLEYIIDFERKKTLIHIATWVCSILL